MGHPTPPSRPEKVDRQREHQANERTFLAWLRTAIALIAFGLTIARFGYLLYELQSSVQSATATARIFQNPLASSQILGTGLISIGVIIILFAVWQYNRVFWQIERADYKPSRLVVWITAGLVVILGILSLPFVFWKPTPPARLPNPAPSDPMSRADRQASDYFSTWLARMLHR